MNKPSVLSGTTNPIDNKKSIGLELNSIYVQRLPNSTARLYQKDSDSRWVVCGEISLSDSIGILTGETYPINPASHGQLYIKLGDDDVDFYQFTARTGNRYPGNWSRISFVQQGGSASSDSNTGGGGSTGGGSSGVASAAVIIDYNPQDNTEVSGGPEVYVGDANTGWDGSVLTASNSSPSYSVYTPDPEDSESEPLYSKSSFIRFPRPTSGTVRLDLSNSYPPEGSGDTFQTLNFEFVTPNGLPLDYVDKAYSGEGIFSAVRFILPAVGSLTAPIMSTSFNVPIIGMDGNNESLPIGTNAINLSFITYMDYALASNGLTIDQAITMIGQETVDVYSNIPVVVIYPEEYSSLEDSLGMHIIHSSLTDMIVSISHEPTTSVDGGTLLPVSVGVILGTVAYVLPDNANDGDFLRILSPVSLLGIQLNANDHLLLLENKTKGICIKGSEVVAIQGGEFRGHLSSGQPSNPNNGDWYIRSSSRYDSNLNSQVTSYLMYVYDSNSSLWKMTGYNTENTSLTYSSYDNTIILPSGQRAAGYIGAKTSAPTLTKFQEQSLYYDLTEKSLRYSSSGVWNSIKGDDAFSKVRTHDFLYNTPDYILLPTSLYDLGKTNALLPEFERRVNASYGGIYGTAPLDGHPVYIVGSSLDFNSQDPSTRVVVPYGIRAQTSDLLAWSGKICVGFTLSQIVEPESPTTLSAMPANTVGVVASGSYQQVTLTFFTTDAYGNVTWTKQEVIPKWGARLSLTLTRADTTNLEVTVDIAVNSTSSNSLRGVTWERYEYGFFVDNASYSNGAGGFLPGYAYGTKAPIIIGQVSKVDFQYL